MFRQQALDILKAKTALVVCGGGVLGIAECAALIELETLGVKMSQFTSVCGSSVGSVIATTIAAGGSTEYMRSVMESIDFETFKDRGLIMKGVRLIGKYGLNQTTSIASLAAKILTDNGHHADITFKELYDKTKVHLTLTYLSLNYERTMYADHLTEPQSKVRDVIVKSASIPLFYTAFIEGGRKRGFVSCDGGTANNYPMNIPREQGVDPAKILGLKLIAPKEATHVENGGPGAEMENVGPPDNVIDYLTKVVSILRRQAMRMHVSANDWQLTVKINVGELSSTDFKITEAQQKWLFDQGTEAMRKYVDDLAWMLQTGTFDP